MMAATLGLAVALSRTAPPQGRAAWRTSTSCSATSSRRSPPDGS
ncbi:hypothetical protein [Microtetraspora malaysiensis]